jgi:hypothetical protein
MTITEKHIPGPYTADKAAVAMGGVWIVDISAGGFLLGQIYGTTKKAAEEKANFVIASLKTATRNAELEAQVAELRKACQMLIVRLEAYPSIDKGSVYDFAITTIANTKASPLYKTALQSHAANLAAKSFIEAAELHKHEDGFEVWTQLQEAIANATRTGKEG